MMNQFTTKLVSVIDADRAIYDNSILNINKIPNLKTAIFEFVQCIHHKRAGVIAEVYRDNKLVGASLFYTKNQQTYDSTTSLYSLFSVVPGAGKVAFDLYWQYAHQNSRWFKFYVNKHAHLFYAKMNFKYWGVSKSGDNYSTFGRIYSDDAKESNSRWFSLPFKLPDRDKNYFEKNIKIFQDKNGFGYPKLKKDYKLNFDQQHVNYVIDTPTLEDMF
jgi:hypothetical protein